MAEPVHRHTLDELLAAAEQRINRLSPLEVQAAMRAGAPLVDIRSAENRERDGIVPGSLHIPRTVLEWRLAPESAWRNPYVGGLDDPLILLCDHGCSTVLAGATLADLGFTRVADVVGGFAAWRAAGLPTGEAPARRQAADELAGMAAPDP